MFQKQPYNAKFDQTDDFSRPRRDGEPHCITKLLVRQQFVGITADVARRKLTPWLNRLVAVCFSLPLLLYLVMYCVQCIIFSAKLQNLIRSLSPYYYWYSITHSLFHSRLKSFLFCKSSLPQPFFFLIQVSLCGFPRLFTLLLSISVFLLFSFSVFTLFQLSVPCGRLS